MSLKPCPHRRL